MTHCVMLGYHNNSVAEITYDMGAMKKHFENLSLLALETVIY